jgi:hypothetical protein
MKTKETILCLIAVMVGVSGCLPSLYPLYTDDTLVFYEELVGKWTNDGDEIWQFTKAGQKEYHLRVIDGDKEARFEAHLVKLGDMTYLDIFPGQNDEVFENVPDLYKFHIIAAHTFMKVELGPDLQLGWVYLGELLQDDPNVLDHKEVGDKLILTAQTKQLQEFIIEHPNDICEEDMEDFTLIEPLFSEDDLVFDEGLLGIWETADGFVLDCTEWEEGYDMVFIDKDGQEHQCVAKLVQLNDMLLLGMFLSEPTPEDIESGLHNIPDQFMVVDQIEPELLLRSVDYEQIAEMLENGSEPPTEDLPAPDYVFERVNMEP